MDVDLQDTVREVEAEFARYEAALMANDLQTLDALFWPDGRTVRFGVAEALYGIEAIRSFRRGRAAAGLQRTLHRTVVTAFGRDFATTSTLFSRPGSPGHVGRQQQSWGRGADGWRSVAAHVSLVPDDGAGATP